MENPPAPSQFPMISLIGIDGKPFGIRDVVENGKATIVYYLSPVCGACAEQTKAITSNLDQMNDVQFLFVTAYTPEITQAFIEDHHISNYENIRFGYDVNLTLQQHYQLTAVPSIYLYNTYGQLSQEWTGYTSVEVLRAAVDGKPIQSPSWLDGDLELVGDQDEPCPAREHHELFQLCLDLAENLEDDDTGIYLYSLTLRELACVPKTSSPENTNKIIREWWNLNASKIRCDLGVENLKNQNILKFAVHYMRKQFLKDLVEEYEVNIDYPDINGISALTFCREEVERIKSRIPVDEGHLKEVSSICDYLSEAIANKSSN
ncbi:hypothetical protein [Algoriphagus boritolerans]